MKDDPIVESVRQARAQIFAECHENLQELMDRLQAAEAQDRDRIVSPEALREKRKQPTSPAS